MIDRVSSSSRRPAANRLADAGHRHRRHRHPAGLAEPLHRAAHRGAVAAHEIVEQALEIARHLDVHAGADGRHHLADFHAAGLQEAGEDVVAVGRDDQLVDRQPHAARGIAGEHVAEIPGRHRERDRPVGRAEGDPAGDVVDRLGGDPRPVDRIHRGQPAIGAKPGVAEHRLHQVLAVVEGALDRDVVDVGGFDRGHLAALDLGHPVLGVQHEDLDPGAVAAGLDGRRAGVARGRGDDRHPLAAPGEDVIEQPADDLQGVVLEGEGRAVEQLQQPVIGVELDQRGDRGMVEPGIGGGGDPGQRRLVDSGPGEPRHHPGGDLVEGKRRQPGQLRGVHAGPGFGQIQAAVGRQPAQQHVLEVQRRRLAAGTHVAHLPPPFLRPWAIRRGPPPHNRRLSPA